MKRIEDKIKEIEKKDRTNRRLYIGVVVLIAVFMVSSLYFGKEISKREETIAKREATISEKEDTITEQKVVQSQTNKKLDESLQPEEYWKHIKEENSVEGYINYILNEWGLATAENKTKAMEALNSETTAGADFQGWLYAGSKTKAQGYISGNRVEVIYRANANGEIQHSEIQKGDIVQLVTDRNQFTYRDSKLRRKNVLGWRNKTKGFVTNVMEAPNSSDFRIEVKYY